MENLCVIETCTTSTLNGFGLSSKLIIIIIYIAIWIMQISCFSQSQTLTIQGGMERAARRREEGEETPVGRHRSSFVFWQQNKSNQINYGDKNVCLFT